MRQEEFKMERTGLVEIGQVIPITAVSYTHLTLPTKRIV